MKNTDYLTKNGVNLEESLKMLGDMETYNETLPNFESGLTKKVNNLKDYLIKNDTANYAIDAHSIKSDAKFFGFMILANVALSHELHAKDNDIEYIKTHFNELEKQVNETLKIINSYMNNELESIKNNKMNVLIADDSDVVIFLAKKILGVEYNITSAYDGAELINILETNTNYDALLLDINMPKINGFDVLEYMNEKNLFDKIPVSIISGNDDKESITKVFKYPIVDMLNKPFNESTIKGILKKTIDRKNKYQ